MHLASPISRDFQSKDLGGVRRQLPQCFRGAGGGLGKVRMLVSSREPGPELGLGLRRAAGREVGGAGAKVPAAAPARPSHLAQPFAAAPAPGSGPQHTCGAATPRAAHLPGRPATKAAAAATAAICGPRPGLPRRPRGRAAPGGPAARAHSPRPSGRQGLWPGIQHAIASAASAAPARPRGRERGTRGGRGGEGGARGVSGRDRLVTSAGLGAASVDVSAEGSGVGLVVSSLVVAELGVCLA